MDKLDFGGGVTAVENLKGLFPRVQSHPLALGFTRLKSRPRQKV